MKSKTDNKEKFEKEAKGFKDNDINKKAELKQQAISKKLRNYFNRKFEENEISYRKWSELSGVSTSVIVDFLKHETLPRIDTLLRLSLAIAPNDTDNMFKEMLENQNIDESSTTPKEQLRNALVDLGLEHNDIVDVRSFIKYKLFCIEERKKHRKQREEKQSKNNQNFGK